MFSGWFFWGEASTFAIISIASILFCPIIRYFYFPPFPAAKDG